MDNLEKIAEQFKQQGDKWVEAKLKSDQLEEDAKSFLAAIMNEMDTGNLSEAKLDRLARGSKPYREFVANMCSARAEMLRQKVRYDALDKLFEAVRSKLAHERETIKKGIFHEGR